MGPRPQALSVGGRIARPVARIFYLAFDGGDQTPLVKKLRAEGHRVAWAAPKYPDFDHLLKQQAPPPELFLADASKQASHVRESLNYIRSLKAHKATPIVVYNVRSEDRARTLERVPGAVVVEGPTVLPELERVLGAPRPL